MLGLACSGGSSLVAVLRHLTAAPSLVAETGLSGSEASIAVAPGLWSTGAVVMVHGLSFSSACVNLPGPGTEPVSPALAGGFFTVEPPGKLPLRFHLLYTPQPNQAFKM